MNFAKHRGGGAPPVVAFLVGLEGSGHHLVEAVVERIAPQIKNCDYDDQVNYWRDTEAPTGSSFLTYLDENPDTHFFGQWSYPAGPEGRTHASARVSLLKLVCLNATGAIDLRLVYLRREPVDAVCSALHRYVNNDTKAVERAAEIALESFVYIDSILNHAEVAYEVIDFAEAMGDMTTMQAPMEFLLRGLATPEAIAKAIMSESATHHQRFNETGPPRSLGRGS
jgi:hypothetical protein